MDHRRFSHAAPFLEIISTLLSSSLCPKPVMSLCAQALVRAFSDPRARGNGGVPPPLLVNLWNTVNKGLGLPESTSPSRFPLHHTDADRLCRIRYSPCRTNAMGKPPPSRSSSDPGSSTQGQTSLPRHRRHPPPHCPHKIPSPLLVRTQRIGKHGKHGPMQTARHARLGHRPFDFVWRVRSAVDASVFAFDLAERDREDGQGVFLERFIFWSPREPRPQHSRRGIK